MFCFLVCNSKFSDEFDFPFLSKALIVVGRSYASRTFMVFIENQDRGLRFVDSKSTLTPR